MPLSPSHIVPNRDSRHATSTAPSDSMARRSASTHLFDAPPGLAFFQCGQTRLMLSRAGSWPAKAARSSIMRWPTRATPRRRLPPSRRDLRGGRRCIARVGDKDIWLAVASDGEGNHVGLMSEQAVG